MMRVQILLFIRIISKEPTVVVNVNYTMHYYKECLRYCALLLTATCLVNI